MARLVVCDRAGKPLSELENARVDSVQWELNSPESFSFSIPTGDSKLLRTQNFVPNPSAESNNGTIADGWVMGKGQAAITQTASIVTGANVVHGRFSQQIVVGALQGVEVNQWWADIYVIDPGAPIRVTPGETLTFSFYLRVTALTRAEVLGYIGFSDINRAWVGGSTGTTVVSATTGSMTRYSVTYTVPAGAVNGFAAVRVRGSSAASAVNQGNATIIVDAVQLERASAVTPFTDRKKNFPEMALHEIQVWDGNTLRAWGVPWTIRGDSNSLTVDCRGLLSYFEKRFLLGTSLDYTSLDQFTIGWNLVNYAQTGTDRNLNIVSGTFSPSGKVRSRRYEREEHPNILDLLMEFTELDQGFDFEIVIYGDGRREWMPYYPSKGSYKPTKRLEWGYTVTDYAYSEDAGNIANHVYATGGSEGDVKFENNYRDAAAAAYRGAFEAITSAGSFLDVNWLLEKATEEVNTRKNPVIIPELICRRDGAFDPLNDIDTGDTVPVRVDHGRVYLWDDYRVVQKVWDIESDLVKVTLNTP